MEKIFEDGKYKIKANASFTIREGWLAKGLRHIAQGEDDVFVREDATDRLGVGTAMVKSLRYWMQAAGLSTEPNSGKRLQTLSELGQMLYKHDRYFEDLFSLYLVHHQLVTNFQLSTMWYLCFNYQTQRRFTREVFAENMLAKFYELGARDVSEKSFYEDCGAVIRTYAREQNGASTQTPEDNMVCPLEELFLMAVHPDGLIEMTTPPLTRLDKLLVLYAIVCKLNGREGVGIDEILNGIGNAGKVFNLSLNRLNEYLDALQAAKYITINRTAGLNMVYPRKEPRPTEILSLHYNR